MQFEVGPAGESAMRLAYAESPHPALTRGLLAIQEQAERRFAGSLIDAVIGYTTLTLFFHPAQLERDRVESWLCEQAENVVPHGSELIEHSTPDVVLPVLYHPSVAPDLEWLADEKGLSIDDVITQHTQTIYFAYATGFAPGFCYLGTLPSQLTTPPAGNTEISGSSRLSGRCRLTDRGLSLRLSGGLAPDRLLPQSTLQPERRTALSAIGWHDRKIRTH